MLVGSGATAWSTGALPWGDERVCWGAIDREDAEALVGGGDVQAHETEPSVTPVDARCTLRGRMDVHIRVHAPGDDRDIAGMLDPLDWMHDFIRPEMTVWRSPGDGVGMAATSEAWQSIPSTCVGNTLGPAVVDITRGMWRQEPTSTEQRDLMARAVSDVADAAMRAWGCDAPDTSPADLPDLPAERELDPGALCGIEGLNRPESHPDFVPGLERLTANDDAGLRTCEVGSDFGNPRFRLTTLTDPALLELLPPPGDYGDGETFDAGRRLEGHGQITPQRAYIRVPCPEGQHNRSREAVFLVRHEHGDIDQVRALLPGYVTGEGARLGCGPVRLDLPEPPRR
ncbi:hypothetical protein [Streptomyces marincola]|uniref:hypothetical protein n=1 Tax=Streptomyces marincola TaxID=2878388 RepID=UPI001CF27F4C|nr:hypothetical protein [Streptomyces marincola]UCM89721.1 hypothetical protein LC193_18155 [Streptomyces marincola]